MTGSPDQGYYRQSKKSFIVWSLFLATAISMLYAYFICVTRSYANALKSPEQLEEERRKAEEEAKNSWMNPDRLNPKNLAPKGDDMMADMAMDMAMDAPAADAM